LGTLDARQGLMAIAAGMASAFFVLSLVSGSILAMPLFYLAPMPLYLAGLAWGAKAAGVAMLGGTLAVGVAGGLLLTMPYAVVMAVPAWLICRQVLLNRPLTAGQGAANQGVAGQGVAGTATDWYPIGDILAWMTMAALGIFMVAAMSIDGGDQDVRDAVAGGLATGFEQMAPHLGPEAIANSVAAMAPLFPGMLGANWLLMTVVNAVMAQGLLRRGGRNARPTPVYSELTLPQWCAWPLLAAAVMALVGSGDMQYLGRNMALVAATPFFMLGLAVVHFIVARLKARGGLLIIFYMILLVSGWAALVVAGVGLLELWIGLRHRYAGGTGPHNPQDEESE